MPLRRLGPWSRETHEEKRNQDDRENLLFHLTIVPVPRSPTGASHGKLG